MEEADRILINSLISIGLEVPNDSITLDDFTPDILINATSLCLEYIFESRNEHQSFPKSCPANMASRYKVGQTLAEALKSLGYNDSVGYQSFLYPNVKDNRRIISFLIESLPKESGPSLVEGLNESAAMESLIKSSFADNWKSPWLPHYCLNGTSSSSSNSALKSVLIPFASDRNRLVGLDDWFDSFPHISAQIADFTDLLQLAKQYHSKSLITDLKIDIAIVTEWIKSMNIDHLDRETLKQSAQPKKPEARKRTKFIGKTESEAEQRDKTVDKSIEEAETEFNALKSQYEATEANYDRLLEKSAALGERLAAFQQGDQQLADELAAARDECTRKQKMSIVLQRDDAAPATETLQSAIDKRELQLANIERQWRQLRAGLTERIDSAKEKQRSKCARTNELSRQLAELAEEMEDCRRDYSRKDGEIRALDDKVKAILAGGGATVAQQQQPQSSRADFTKRILELAENKKKQNEEIRKILGDIFRLQKEINALRGKLDRSFVETSECIAQWARKDDASRRMHKVLLGIHDNCSSLVDGLEEKGRLQREIRDLEAMIDNENRDDVEKNLEKITTDFDEAQKSCEHLKRLIKEHKGAARLDGGEGGR